MKFNVKRYFQVLGVSLAVVIAAAAVCMGIDFSGDDIAAVNNEGTVAVQGGKLNILLMGTDIDGLRTDAIMLACVDMEKKEVNMLTIPRDTKMYIGNRYQKINAAHAYVKNGEIGGPTATCEAVTRLTGIPINFYVDFSFDAVAHVINELGPIEFEVPDLYNDGVGMVYDDPVQSLHINLPPGKYGEGSDCDYPGLTGQQAVWLMRYRHGNRGTKGESGYATGDLGRVEVQQQFIKAVIDQKVNSGLVMKIPAIFKEVSGEIKTNFSINDIITYSKIATDFSSANINSYSTPGAFGHDNVNGDVWITDMDKMRELTETVFGYDASGASTGNPDDTSSFEAGKSTNAGAQSSSGSSGSSSSSSSSSYDDDDDYSYSGSSNSSSGSSSSGSSSGSSYSDYDDDDDVSGSYSDYDDDDYDEDE